MISVTMFIGNMAFDPGDVELGRISRGGEVASNGERAIRETDGGGYLGEIQLLRQASEKRESGEFGSLLKLGSPKAECTADTVAEENISISTRVKIR